MNPHHFEVTIDDVFAVIREAETGGHPNPYEAVGNDGELGPFQITYPYFCDAIEQDPSLYGVEFDGVRDEGFAKMIMLNYWDRYATKPWIPEELCRLHNGGPSMRGTDAYWEKCRGLFR